MNEIMINNMPLSIKEYEGKRVVTFKDIDMCHKRPEGTARKRFNDNKARFVEGEDFYKVPYDWNNESPVGGRSLFDIVNEIEGYRGMDYSGFIYMAQDPNNGFWKIGRTASKKTIEKRLNLSRTDELKDYRYFDCVDTLRADKMIQERLKSYKVKNSWYDCDSNVIEDEIKNSISKVEATHEPRKRHKGGFHGDVTLITESGYYMLVKSFTDDLSWDVQRQLVNSYFKVSKPELPQMSAMEMIAAIAGNAAKLEKKCAELERKFNGIERDRDTINDILVEQDTTLKETKETIDEAKEKIENVCSTISLDKGEWRKNTHKLVVKISRMFPDLYKNVGMVYNELYKLLEARAGVNLNARLRHMKSRMKKEGVSESKISLKNNIDVIAEDKKLTEIYIAIVKELAVNLGMGKIGL